MTVTSTRLSEAYTARCAVSTSQQNAVAESLSAHASPTLLTNLSYGVTSPRSSLSIWTRLSGRRANRKNTSMRSISNRYETIILRLLENYLARIDNPKTTRDNEERRKVIKAIKYLKK